jgi:hypothetical protein
MSRIATREKMNELLTLHREPQSLTVKKTKQFRLDVIQDNLSNPLHDRSPKAPKPLSEQVKRSSRVRSYDNPTELGSTHGRFIDPSGNAFKARKEYIPDATYDPLWIGFPGTTDKQPEPDNMDIAQGRHKDAVGMYQLMNYISGHKPYPIDALFPTLLPCQDAMPSPVYTVPVYRPLQAPTMPVQGDIPLDRTAIPCHAIERLPAVRNPPTFDLRTVTGLAIPGTENKKEPRKVPTLYLLVATYIGPFPPMKTQHGPVAAYPWNAKTRKTLFNRDKIQSRSKAKKGTRLTPKLLDTVLGLVSV